MKHRKIEHISSHGVLDMFEATRFCSMQYARRGGIVSKVPYSNISILLNGGRTVKAYRIDCLRSMEFVDAHRIFPIG
jgi:hypothetical protein